jgi:DNA-directed RNA polymerase specialized sigma24 family protein
MNDQVEQILRPLDENDRRLIELRLEGCGTAEAARKLGLDPDVSRVRLNRLRKRLEASGVRAKLV